MKNEETEFRALYEQYLEWKTSQAHQTDGYEYERSFMEFTRQMNASLLKLSLESPSTEKKKFKLA